MAEEKRFYRVIEPVSSADAEAAIVRNDPDELRRVVIAVGRHSDDLEWSESFCLRLSQHTHYNVRANAIQSFGHIARRFRRLDNPESIRAVQDALVDTHDYVRSEAEDAADEIEWCAKLQVRKSGSHI